MNTIPNSNVSAFRKNVMDWNIRSQVAGKLVKGSTTTKSNLSLFGMAKFARMGWFIVLKNNIQDIVWTIPKGIEDGIKSPSIT